MEQQSMSEFMSTLQLVVKEYENDASLKVTEVHQEKGVDKGENYLSLVFRMKVKGETGNGNEYRKSFIRKTRLGNGKFAIDARTDDLFCNEAYVYAKLLPLLGTFGPDCLIISKDEIIMEDLHLLNYSICERRNLLDRQHCDAVIKTLATMHATSFNLKLKSPRLFEKMVEPLTENIYPSDGGACIGSYIESSLDFAIKTLDSIDPQTENIIRAGKFLKQYQNRVIDVMQSLLAPEDDRRTYWVLTHGDTWNNNILFRYDSKGGIEGVKLVDFQVARHSSPALDFGYFLYTSARPEVLNDLNTLVDLYEDEFMRVLRSLNEPNTNLDSIFVPGWFSAELQFYSLFGFFSALMVLHAVYMDDKEIENIAVNLSAPLWTVGLLRAATKKGVSSSAGGVGLIMRLHRFTSDACHPDDYVLGPPNLYLGTKFDPSGGEVLANRSGSVDIQVAEWASASWASLSQSNHDKSQLSSGHAPPHNIHVTAVYEI